MKAQLVSVRGQQQGWRDPNAQRNEDNSTAGRRHRPHLEPVLGLSVQSAQSPALLGTFLNHLPPFQTS